MPTPHGSISQDLIDGYLDELLTADEHYQLSDWIKADPSHARQFAEAVMLHDRLRADMLAADMLTAEEPLTALQPVASREAAVAEASTRRRVAGIFSAVCLLLVAVFVGWRASNTSAVAASVALERIIQACERAKDRTYLITSLEDGASSRSEDVRKQGGEPSVDGAILHVRGAEQYVLERFYADGTRFVTGSDSATAWAVPPHGRVRVSGDLNRFRGTVPGQQHAIPFVDMTTSLRQLTDAYELADTISVSSREWRQITASRKPSVNGGPKRITIHYDAETGLIHAMVLERLPQARGGPRSVELTLVESSDLGPGFFSHAAHHEASRDVVEE